jgi:3D (Asp-Asp-Asp) domain-containing protein
MFKGVLKMKKKTKLILIAGIIASGLVNIRYPYVPINIIVDGIHSASNEKKITAVNKSKSSTLKNKTDLHKNINNNTLKKNSASPSNIKDTTNNIINKTNTNVKSKQMQLSENTKINSDELSRGGNVNEVDITLTFYTSLSEENGGFKGINCSGRKLIPGMVANNVLPQGTKILTKEFGTLTVDDKGGSNFNTIHRLDVYVPRNYGESDDHYRRRVSRMGRVNVKGFILD